MRRKLCMLSPRGIIMRPSYLVILASLIYVLAWPSPAKATVFRDRAAFNAASRNLHTLDFESVAPLAFELDRQIDGVFFESIGGMEINTGFNSNKMLLVRTVGEITRLTVFLPPGTTA